MFNFQSNPIVGLRGLTLSFHSKISLIENLDVDQARLTVNGFNHTYVHKISSVMKENFKEIPCDLDIDPFLLQVNSSNYGNYTLTITSAIFGKVNATLALTGQPSVDPPTVTATTSHPGNSSIGLSVGLAIAGFVVAAVLMVLIVKRYKKAPNKRKHI